MKIQRRQTGDVHVFELAGELDFHTSPDLRSQLQAVAEKPAHKIVVSLKKVSYIDSSGLATFVEALQKAKRGRGKLVLAEMGSSVKSVFEIAKLDKIFILAATEVEAMDLIAR